MGCCEEYCATTLHVPSVTEIYLTLVEEDGHHIELVAAHRTSDEGCKLLLAATSGADAGHTDGSMVLEEELWEPQMHPIHCTNASQVLRAGQGLPPHK